MIKKELADAINEQIGHELLNSVQYLTVAAYFDQEGLKKVAELYYKQSEEERMHGLKFLRYMVDTGAEMSIPSLPAPKAGFHSAEEAVQLVVDVEWDTTHRINRLMDMAVEQKDYLAQDMLRWFVTEQLEEVSTQENILRMVHHAGPKNLMMLEAYLAHK